MDGTPSNPPLNARSWSRHCGPRQGAPDVRRLAPRPLCNALANVLPDVAPATLLAQVQAAWKEVAGDAAGGGRGPRLGA